MAAVPPHSDRSARRVHRTRVRAAIAAGVVAALAVGIAGWALLRDDAKASPKKRAAAPSTTMITTTTTPKPVAAVTATQKVPEVTAYQDAVETSAAVTKLSAKTEYGLPRTFLVTDDPDEMRSFMSDVAPRVREEVETRRSRSTD